VDVGFSIFNTENGEIGYGFAAMGRPCNVEARVVHPRLRLQLKLN
jgi:hypothetical protein